MDPPRSSLCPGYKHVSAFSPSLSSPKSKNILLAGFEQNISSPANENGAEEDTDYEEEVEYVVLDLGNIEPTLVPSSSSYRLIVRLFSAAWVVYKLTRKASRVLIHRRRFFSYLGQFSEDAMITC